MFDCWMVVASLKWLRYFMVVHIRLFGFTTSSISKSRSLSMGILGWSSSIFIPIHWVIVQAARFEFPYQLASNLSHHVCMGGKTLEQPVCGLHFSISCIFTYIYILHNYTYIFLNFSLQWSQNFRMSRINSSPFQLCGGLLKYIKIEDHQNIPKIWISIPSHGLMWMISWLGKSVSSWCRVPSPAGLHQLAEAAAHRPGLHRSDGPQRCLWGASEGLQGDFANHFANQVIEISTTYGICKLWRTFQHIYMSPCISIHFKMHFKHG